MHRLLVVQNIILSACSNEHRYSRHVPPLRGHEQWRETASRCFVHLGTRLQKICYDCCMASHGGRE
jgi:hypothetical protein